MLRSRFKIQMCLFFIFGIYFSSLLEAASPLKARKELNSIGIDFDKKSFEKSLSTNDDLVVHLFLKARLDPNYVFSMLSSLSHALKQDLPEQEIDLVMQVINSKERSQLKLLNGKLTRNILKRINHQFDYFHHLGTPLMMATLLGHQESFELLLDYDVNVNHVILTHDYQQTALQMAVERCDYEFTKALIKKGADVNLKRGKRGIFVHQGLKKCIENSDLSRANVYESVYRLLKLLKKKGMEGYDLEIFEKQYGLPSS